MAKYLVVRGNDGVGPIPLQYDVWSSYDVGYGIGSALGTWHWSHLKDYS